ncbi:uncharacterized protein hdly isoform X2 [Diabrotica undecimpunctata]
MKSEYVAVAIVALATAYCAGSTPLAAAENRFGRDGNRAAKATDFQRANTAAPAASEVFPDADEDKSDRWKRANDPWDGEHSEFKSFVTYSVWKPPVYQLNRPYFIPIYGSNGRIPIYFAPQPYDKPPYVAPSYLPPKEYPITTETPMKTTMTVKDRFNFDDEDDRPVWDKGSNDNNNKEYNNKPARPPTDGGTIPLSAQDEDTLNEIFTTRPTQSPPNRQTRPTRPMTPTRTPKIPQRTRPTTPRTTTTTRRTPTTDGPSNCVWAVVSCCSANSDMYPEACFEQRGCPGPFWGDSPCGTEFAKAAVESALKYYNPRK